MLERMTTGKEKGLQIIYSCLFYCEFILGEWLMKYWARKGRVTSVSAETEYLGDFNTWSSIMLVRFKSEDEMGIKQFS